MKKVIANFIRKEIFVKEKISVPVEELTEEDLKSIHYCDLADSQL